MIEKNPDKKKIGSPRIFVGVFIINERDEVLLLKDQACGGKYNVPTVCAEAAEALELVLRRHVWEALGIELPFTEFISFAEETETGDYKLFMYYYSRVDGNPEPKEKSDCRWLRLSDWSAHKDIWPGLKAFADSGKLEQVGLMDKYRRALADYQNLLKRTALEKEEFAKYASEIFIMEILPAYDNLRVSLEHIDEAARSSGWAEGIKYVVKQFQDILAGLGVEEIEAIGKEYDHHSMEALEGEGKKVIRSAKAGYKYKGKVIVPAKVILGE